MLVFSVSLEPESDAVFCVCLAPVTSVVASPTSPKDSLLVASLDSTVRLMDRTNGQVRHYPCEVTSTD